MLKDRIEKLIDTLDIKKGDFAEKVGFTQAYISMILNGSKQNPSDRFYEAVKREFNVNINWLKNDIGDMFIIEDENLSSIDREILMKYNQLPLSERKIINEIVDAMLVRNQVQQNT